MCFINLSFYFTRGKKQTVEKKKRRKKKEESSAEGGNDDDIADDIEDDADEEDEESNEDDEEMDVGDDDMKHLAIDSEINVTNGDTKNSSEKGEKLDSNDVAMGVPQNVPSVSMETEPESMSAVTTETEESVFKLTVGPQSSTSAANMDNVQYSESVNLFVPPPRMNTMLAVKNGALFMYGGIYEVGDKQITLSDMYSLDMNKMEEWNIIIESDLKTQVCLYLTLLF